VGLCRNIERHNFLIYSLLKTRVESFPFKGRVVDLGCGDSPYKEAILRSADEYVGVDHPGSKYGRGQTQVIADLEGPFPFEDASFDTAVAFQILDDVPEPQAFLSECFRILRPDGQIFLTAPFMWHLHEEPRDFFRFSRHGLQYLLGKCGFVDIQIEEIAGFWQTWFLKFNYHTTRYAWGPIKYVWYIVWWLTQMIAPLLDNLERGRPNREPTHYSASARKPVSGGPR
jgi:SAM-dependent methyltransferase